MAWDIHFQANPFVQSFHDATETKNGDQQLSSRSAIETKPAKPQRNTLHRWKRSIHNYALKLHTAISHTLRQKNCFKHIRSSLYTADLLQALHAIFYI